MAKVMILSLPLLLACGPKTAAPTAGAASQAAAASVTGDFPSDANSQAFLQGLTGMTIRNFAAVDSGGAQVVLSTLNFAADNSWTDVGYVDAGDERMECSEAGTWTMEEATSGTSATITWGIGDTDCIGREVGTETRAKIDIVGDDIEVAFR